MSAIPFIAVGCIVGLIFLAILIFIVYKAITSCMNKDTPSGDLETAQPFINKHACENVDGRIPDQGQRVDAGDRHSIPTSGASSAQDIPQDNTITAESVAKKLGCRNSAANAHRAADDDTPPAAGESTTKNPNTSRPIGSTSTLPRVDSETRPERNRTGSLTEASKDEATSGPVTLVIPNPQLNTDVMPTSHSYHSNQEDPLQLSLIHTDPDRSLVPAAGNVRGNTTNIYQTILIDKSQKTQVVHHDNRQQNTSVTNVKIKMQQSESSYADLSSDSTHVFHPILNELLNSLTVEDDLLNFLLGQNVLAQSECERIKHTNNTDMDKAVYLLKYVSKKGDKNMALFMLGLYKHGHKHVVEIIVVQGLIAKGDNDLINTVLDTLLDKEVHTFINDLLTKNGHKIE